MLNLNKYSPENLKKIQKALKIILDGLELQGIKRCNKILLEKFEKAELNYDEVTGILNSINENEKISILINVNRHYQEKKKEKESFLSPHYKPYIPPTSTSEIISEQIKREFHPHPIESSGLEQELDTNIVLKVKNLNELKKIKESVDKKLKKIARAHTERVKDKKEIEKQKNLITRNKINGDFYYKNKPIKFENRDTIYYLIFECLYEKSDAMDFCSYETINRYLEKHGKEKHINNQQIKDRIKNGILNLFRFSNLPPKAPEGKKLIQKVRGKGIILYNPPL